ncbi:AAA family ATPase [Hansschlegelia quercus]|uniref:ATP-binding protein n=1 Tax=Hansschlegelia quercus TaxID=2528245 RepID=A0A4Q9GLJ7_9HYPH|nr:ATP-binding protein [Hansschlegelia quercus]TBN53574.1 ATP-binding protein [Hansschlegelia quercus]
MATAEQVIALVRSYTRQDEGRFLQVAAQVAEEAEARGQNRVAAEIRGLLDDAAAQSGVIRKSADPIPLARPRGELAGIMSVAMPDRRLGQMVLSDDLSKRLDRIVKEQRERTRLRERGLEPRRKFLMTGPPGTGKTLSAGAIAAELGLPLFTVLLDGLITKYMGETAAKLRLVFDAMTERRGVYFFDEVDALAGSRGADNEVGEARRILISFLQFLDEDKSASLIFAATNHPEILDRAFFRRFDASILFGLPAAELVQPLVEETLVGFKLENLDWYAIRGAAHGLSQADIVRASDDAARVAVLEHDGHLTTAQLIESLRENATQAR